MNRIIASIAIALTIAIFATASEAQVPWSALDTKPRANMIIMLDTSVTRTIDVQCSKCHFPWKAGWCTGTTCTPDDPSPNSTGCGSGERCTTSSFEAIANTPGMNETKLRAQLQNSHANMSSLNDIQQLQSIIDYILGLNTTTQNPPLTATTPAPSGGGYAGIDIITKQTSRTSLSPGSDVAKDSVRVVNPGGQQRVAGGTITIIPQNPTQPMTVTPLVNGTAMPPSHGPGDTVIVTPSGHQPVTIAGWDINNSPGLVITVPPKPPSLLIFGGAQAPAITENTVKAALKGQYGMNFAANVHINWVLTDETIGDPPNQQHFAAVFCDPYLISQSPVVAQAPKSVPQGDTSFKNWFAYVPATNTWQPVQASPSSSSATGGLALPDLVVGSGPAIPPETQTPRAGEVYVLKGPASQIQLDGSILDPRLLVGTPLPADQPTKLSGGLIAEGDWPREIEGPPPAAPFATSKGTWQQGYPDQWWLSAIDWLKQDGTSVLPDRGAPVIVAVIDTGVDFTHPDLAGMAWVNPEPGKGGYVGDVNGWNFVAESPDIRDRNGHGTVVAGIIAANPNKSFGIAGINPWARIMALKAMEIDGKGGSIAITRAIIYAVKHGAKVINLSVGGKHLSYAEQKALDYAAQKGVLVVVASGNQGADTAGFSPAGLKHALTVAAIGPDLKRQTFSNWGANVALAAPGVDILSLRAKQTDLLLFARKDYKPGTGVVARNYYRVTGSSFSAPMVSGAAALLMSARPELSAVDVTHLLEQSARDVGGIGKDQFIGYGLIDVDAALKADPKVYVEAGISGVAVVSQGGRTLVRVSGTASADRLQEAYIEIGQGGAPQSWKRVSRPIQPSVTDGVLDDLDPAVFAGGKEWTLRVIAVHQNGKRREARYKLTLG